MNGGTDGSERDSATEAGQRPAGDFLVVGLGGSAGAITAFREFFRNVPAESGMAYVVILHLSPDHDSRLAEVLQQATEMPVEQVTEAVRVEPDRVYVIPPNKSLSMYDGMLVVADVAGFEERRAPVDIFFRTLAESHGSRAVSVTLSGTGANGSMGLKRVKERGGLVLAQEPSEAEFEEMPRNSIATGFVDYVLPVASMPAKIIAYREQLDAIRIPVETEERAEADERALVEIFTQLRVRTGHDFTNYKRATVLRRIARRMGVHEIADLPSYSNFMREHQEEAPALLKDLLISVTNFFRDPQAFEALEQEVIPRLFEDKGPEGQVRVWVAGCATGEEAYTIAMLLAEYAAELAFPPAIQVFASDLDEQSITQARGGYYTLNDVADVSPERLRQFFVKEENGFRVRRELREMVLFAHHNLIKDPPFSHLDLATCRNLLIYLNRSAQEHAMEVLHFALNPNGFLMLGTSESTEGASDLFKTFDKEQHIYQGRAVTPRLRIPSPDLLPAKRVDRAAPDAPLRAPVLPAAQKRLSSPEQHQRLLELYGPPSVVVNEEYDIVHVSERAVRYLHISAGEPSLNLLAVIRPEVRLELRAALLQAAQEQTSVEVRGLVWEVGERAETVNVVVRPAPGEGDPSSGLFLILFEEARSTEGAGAEAPVETIIAAEPAAHRLENENTRLRTQMRTTVEQYETQAEESKAANEELQAMNEELRSTTEELETAKEELQSLNEELHTVNQELKVKIEELGHSNDDMRNLMSSTEIGTVFLDRGLRVKMFTPRVRDIFNLLPTDVGRPLTDITHRLAHDLLLDDAESVIERLHTVEREVGARDGSIYLVRLLPYRTADDHIEGVVLTFFDITERKRADEALHEREEKYRTLFTSIDEGFCTIEVLFNDAGEPYDYRFLETNPAFERQTGIENCVGRTMREIAPAHEEFWFEMYGRIARTAEAVRFEHEAAALGRYYDVYAFRIGEPEQNRVAMLFNDISEHKRAQDALRESEERFRLFVTAASESVYRMNADWSEMLLLEGKSFLADTRNPSLTWLEQYIPDGDKTLVQATIAEVIRAKTTFELEHRAIRADGTVGWVFSRAIPFLDERGRIVEWFGAASDITARKHAEERQEFLLKLSDTLRSLTGADEIQETAARTLGEQLKVARAFYFTVERDEQSGGDVHVITRDYYRHPNMASIVGRYPQPASGENLYADLSQGEKLVMQDVNKHSGVAPGYLERYRKLGIQSFIAVPLVKHGRYVAAFGVNDAEPRNWTTEEIALVEETAQRTWAAVERARAEEALRESEARRHLALDAAEMGTFVWHPREDRGEPDARMLALFGLEPGDTLNLAEALASMIHPDDRQLYADAVADAVSPNGDGRLYAEIRVVHLDTSVHWIAVTAQVFFEGEPSQAVRMYGTAADITERKRREANLAFLAEVSEDLADLTNIEDTMNALGAKIGAHFNASVCAFGEVDEEQQTVTIAHEWKRADVPSFKGVHRIGDFWNEEFRRTCRAGETYVVRDTANDARSNAGQMAALSIGSVVCVPLVREGEWRFTLSIADANPHVWMDTEIELIRELTTRIWARLERARAEEALRQSEARLQRMVNVPRVGVLTFDYTGALLHANDAFLEMVGYDRAEFAAKKFTWRDFTPSEYVEASMAIMEQLRETGRGGPYEKEYFRKDGSRMWLMFVAADLGDGTIVEYATDITERKRAEGALRENKERLSEALHAAQMGSWRANLADGLGTRDANLNRILGHEAVETTQEIDDCFRLIHPDDKAAAVAAWQKAIDTQGIYETEFRLVREDGTTRWLREQGRFVAGAEGKPDFMTGLTTDITERKEAEAHLRESEERLRTIFESSRDGILVEEDERIIYINQAYARLFGYEAAEELIGKHISSVIAQEDAERLLRFGKDRMRGELSASAYEFKGKRKDGALIEVEASVSASTVGGHTIITTMLRDITERKRAEEALKRLNEELEGRVAERTVELLEMNTSLQAEISERRRIEQERAQILRRLVMAQEEERRRIARDMHDQFGQQLTALLLKLGMLKEDCRGREELCGQVESLESVARQLDRDVDFLVWELRPTILDDLGLREALANFAQNWSEHFGIPVETHVGDIGHVRLTSEIETVLYRIAQEALNNVSKHARAARVSILLEQHTDFISLIVEDDGVGFDDEEMSDANDRGLGLVGMRERAALVGGTTVVESRPDEGTTVIVRIPTQPVSAKEGQQ